MSAWGLGCSLIPGARWLCRRRMLRWDFRSFTVAGSARNGDGTVGVAAVEFGLLFFGVGRAVNLSALLGHESQNMVMFPQGAAIRDLPAPAPPSRR
jgi:hypothetical protein